MRILFMGTPEFALPSLEILLEHSYDIVGVVTVPDKPQGRGRKTLPSPVKTCAQKHRLPVLQPERLDDPSFLSSISKFHPDLIVVVAFRVLPAAVYSSAAKGAFNLHASLLPKYRGAAPIHWAIINGERETGVTTFFLREKVDTGSIILQARVKIDSNETAGELHDKLSLVGAEIVLQTVRLIELGKAVPRSQDDSAATRAPKIFKKDCRIPWGKRAPEVHDFVRGLSPHPAAWTLHKNRTLTIYQTRLEATGAFPDVAPGTVVVAEENHLVASTGEGSVSILELQLEGRKRMGVAEFLRGYSVHIGDVFE